MARQIEKRIGNPHVRLGFFGDMEIDARDVVRDPRFIETLKRMRAMKLVSSRHEPASPAAAPARAPRHGE